MKSIFSVLCTLLASVASATGNGDLVARRDFDAAEGWWPKKVLGREFYVSFTYHEWLDPESKDPKPDLELYRESGIRLTGGKSIDWKAIERNGKTYAKFMEKPQIKSPLTAAELIGPMAPYYAKRFEGGNRPILVNPFCHRPAFFLEPGYNLDLESYRSWAAKHPNLIGIMELAEFDSDAYAYEVLFNTITDEKLKARLNSEFPPPRDRWEWLDFARRCVERTKSVMFGEKRLWTMNSSDYTLSHVMASLGASGVVYEATSQEMGRWQTAGAFMRGTARQWNIPFAWYIANWATGFTRDGKVTQGENCWTEDYRDTSKPMLYYSPRAPHLGAGISAIARQSAYGYLAGATFEEPENWSWTHRAPGTDAEGRPNVSQVARDLDELYRLSKRVDRGAVYAPCAILTPLAARYGVKGDTRLCGHDQQQNAFFFSLVPVKADDIRHRSLRKAGDQSCLFNSRFGEFYDVLVPDAGQATEEFRKALSAYKCAFLAGEFRKSDLDLSALTVFVNGGGTLFIAADKVVDGLIPADMAGLSFSGGSVRSSAKITDECGKTFDPAGEYDYLKAKAVKAKALLKDENGTVAAYVNEVGKGKVVTVTAAGMIPVNLDYPNGFEALVAGRLSCGIVEYLLSRVQAETMPVSVTGDIQWGINRTKDGAWILWLINNKGVTKFSFEPEEFDPKKTAHVSARFAFPVASAKDLRTEREIAVVGNAVSAEVGPGEMKIFKCVAAADSAAVCAEAAGYSFNADFSVKDDADEAYGIDIERISHYSHGHGKVVDGEYAILLNGNRHYLATPKLADFRLDLVWNIQTTHSGGPGYGIVVRFRRDRESGADHMLEVFRARKTNRLAITVDGREIAARENDATDFATDQKLELEVSGAKGRVSVCGIAAGFDIAADHAKGYVALDAASDSQQQLYVRSVSLTSPENPAKREVAKYTFVLDKTQGFSLPVEYGVTLSKYESGETLFEAGLSGTIRSRPLEGRVITGGGEWGSVLEKIDTPYVRIIKDDGGEFSKCNFWNGEKTLLDEEVQKFMQSIGRPCTAQDSWPKKTSVVYYRFPEKYSLAAGYRHAIANPWRFAEENAREKLLAQDGTELYDGEPLAGGAICFKVKSPADKRLVSKIPADIPMREAALKHAKEQHYFYESEKISFDVEAYFKDADWSADEVKFEAKFTDVYNDPVPAMASVSAKGDDLLSGGIRRVVKEVCLDGFLKVGVYKLHVNGRPTVFEVLPDDPDGPCPPLASKLPQLVSMPNEVKYLEQNVLDPWGDVGGVAHYYSVDNRYPLVGNKLEIWRMMPIYRRLWWCWNWNRNSDKLEMRSDFNKDLIRHANVFGGADERYAWDGRYELGVVNYYTGYQMKLLRDFLKAKGLEDKVPTPEPFTFEALRTLFNTCWREWVDYARTRIDAREQDFVDYLLSANPKVGQATYGPYAFYVTHYKTAYTLTYGGYPVIDDKRLRENGSFWLFEEYHHSCDYPLFRPAFFVATYDLHFGDKSRKIFPEIYYSGWGRCLDGAVYMAHPMSRTFLADVHQRRIAYQYTYGTPQFKDGTYKFWTDYGFHARNPENGAMEEFVHAWGNVIKNEPKRALKAPFVVHDLDALKRNGEYFDDECNSRFRTGADEWKDLSDICNSGEDDLAYAFEQAVVDGYTTPVATTFKDVCGLNRGNAEFVILPPIVEGTPKEVLDAIRALNARGVNLLAFEQVAGLEDLFGVKRVPERKVGYLKGESFSHKLAKARYAADGSETVLFAAEKCGDELDIPLVMKRQAGGGRAVLVNAPASAIRRASFRTVFHWGQDSLSENLKSAMREAFAYLAPEPAVKSEHGLASAAYTAADDVAIVVSDEPPIYKDRTVYPVPFRFTVSAPGIGDAAIKADTGYTVISRERDRVVIRARMERDNAYFFKFRTSAGSGRRSPQS